MNALSHPAVRAVARLALAHGAKLAGRALTTRYPQAKPAVDVAVRFVQTAL